MEQFHTDPIPDITQTDSRRPGFLRFLLDVVETLILSVILFAAINAVSARIRVDGSVVPCGACNILVGNLKENSFSEIWNSPLYRDFRRKTIRRKGLAGLSEECEYGIQSGQ